MSSGGDLDEDADGAGFDDVGAAAVLADLKSAPLPVGMDDTSGAAAGALGNTFPDSTWPDNAPLAIEPLVAAPSGGFASVHQGFDDPLRSLGFNNKQVRHHVLLGSHRLQSGQLRVERELLVHAWFSIAYAAQGEQLHMLACTLLVCAVQ